jgi:hypothetical protein
VQPLSFCIAETVGHRAVAFFAAVVAITVTSELPAPALQRGMPQARPPGHQAGRGTIFHSLIKDLQILLAVVRPSQSSLRSAQRA